MGSDLLNKNSSRSFFAPRNTPPPPQTHTHTRKQMDKYKKTEKEERTYASYQHMNPNVSPHYECRPLTMKLKSKNITRSINVAFIQGEAAHCVVHVRFFNTHKKRTHFLLFLESNEILTNYKKWT